MRAVISHNKKNYKIDLSRPLDISITLRGHSSNVIAWLPEAPRIEPHTEGEFVGKVSAGASVNFNDISFNPHAHGTHTECVGHITNAFHSVNETLSSYFWLSELVTIAPEKYQDDFVISRKQLQYALGNKKRDAVIIRTLPNTGEKRKRHYSNTNPPYLLEEAAQFLAAREVAHLLVDLPSVDREADGGSLLAHKAFWRFDDEVRMDATITELIYVDNKISDGTYFLNLQMASFENDASPSRPVLYGILEEE